MNIVSHGRPVTPSRVEAVAQELVGLVIDIEDGAWFDERAFALDSLRIAIGVLDAISNADDGYVIRQA